MICFPNAKINIGLNILRKRADGFHDLESLFIPIPLHDILEFVESKNTTSFTNSGLFIDSKPESNLVMKAYRLLSGKFRLPELSIYLNKVIPFGAGLGGGSADAAFMLVSMNDFFQLGISVEELEKLAAQLGSDCPFFVRNTPALASGRGEILTPFKINLNNYYLLLVKPPISVPTAQAYSKIIPSIPKIPLKEALTHPISEWNQWIKNDFEKSVFDQYPQVGSIKEKLLRKGALYASMSGSGSSVFGIFEVEPHLLSDDFPDNYFIKTLRL